ncbi:hypothetical protein PPL_00219 [Heterostelium album PN500]|uniref:Uncharacterized protein n=1 Tax=Heterostelium pallidum (strain ATCC 26659 / Pp 5 / PN500) TaxID=670386 RepID=D3AVV4_HETP5|nr:hypothetical protein PPL_00219 [Heterostelium album PN500]EFA86427.1 hypothetical protein PPL_00219 [Heterostelium album PN500]|eukprot:XP_020438532.1 hypothetical protein PPL_00219 [Heterostelium album PN500]
MSIIYDYGYLFLKLQYLGYSNYLQVIRSSNVFSVENKSKKEIVDYIDQIVPNGAISTFREPYNHCGAICLLDNGSRSIINGEIRFQAQVPKDIDGEDGWRLRGNKYLEMVILEEL